MDNSPIYSENEFEQNEDVDIINYEKQSSFRGKIIETEGEYLTVLNMDYNQIEKYDKNDGRVIKKWVKGKNEIKILNSVDIRIKDTEDWAEGIVLDINNYKVLIKYFSLDESNHIVEEWIDINSDRLADSGEYTKLDLNLNKLLSSNQFDASDPNFYKKDLMSDFLGMKRLFSEYKEKPDLLIEDEENEFLNLLHKNNFQIKEVSGDGNCLFRSISDQVYGTDKYHEMIREKCMDYLVILKEYFKPYIEGDFDEYIKEKRKDAVWGDDVEIEALSEMYARPIEIYMGSETPIKSFHEDKYKSNGISKINKNNITPIRLSYHRGNHYNSIIPLDNDKEKYDQYYNSLIKQEPGVYEDKTLSIAKTEEKEYRKAIQLSEESFRQKRVDKNLSEKILDIVKKNDSKLNLIINKEKSQSKIFEKMKKIKKDEEKKENVKNKIEEKNEEKHENIKDKIEEKDTNKEKEIANELEDARMETILKALNMGFEIEDINEALLIYQDNIDIEVVIEYITQKNKNENK